MAEININVIDGIGVNKEQNAIWLLLCDYLEWDSEKAMKHSEHLFLLRKKIDAYVKFLEKRQYKDKYPNLEPVMKVIDIRFQYQYPETCEQFLQEVEKQLGALGIKLDIRIGYANCI